MLKALLEAALIDLDLKCTIFHGLFKILNTLAMFQVLLEFTQIPILAIILDENCVLYWSILIHVGVYHVLFPGASIKVSVIEKAFPHCPVT